MTKSELKLFLRQPFSDNIENGTVRTLVKRLFGAAVELFTSPNILVESKESIRLSQQIGSIPLSDGRNLAIFDVTVTDSIQIARNRKGLRDAAAKYIDQSVIYGAIVFYHNPNQSDYRLSFISRYAEFDLETGQLIKGETKPKRYTFLLGPNESCTTAAERLGDLMLNTRPKRLKELEEAFSVERLNRDFFKEYRWHYERFWRYIAERPDYADVLRDPERPTKELQEKPIRDFAKKLLGRMVFLYFLQKKGWMGCKSNQDSWIEGDPFFVRTLFTKFPYPEQFYSEGLTKLYFQTLNVKRSGDRFVIDGMEPCRVPYLNGGLFDDAHEKASHFDFPPEYFSALLDFFDQYNFTIDENSPDEQEVGIDPEMLGHIFENLLEENRDKGTFYTPKSIVYYICREALINYLAPHFPDAADIEGFVKQHRVSDYLSQQSQANALDSLLNSVRVCDPAIGSGAFPIAMMQEIFQAKLHIYPYRKTIDPFDPAKVKLSIIENNIYGVDLDSGAVDIARLRFWLTLVVDEDAPRQLPNLDYKIMQGNSLFEQFEDVDLSRVHHMAHQVKVFEPDRDLFGNILNPQLTMTYHGLHEVDLSALIKRYFEANDPKRKKKLRTDISDHINDHINYNLERREESLRQSIALAGNVDVSRLKAKDRKRLDDYRQQLQQIEQTRQRLIDLQQTNERPYFLWHLFFQDVFAEGGFDIIIGNPPYFSVSKQPALKAIQEKYDTYESTGDIYALFYELGYRMLRPGGTLAYITGSSWLRSNYGKSLRNFFIQKTNPVKLIDFSDSEIFESATVRTTLFVFKREPNERQLKALRLTRRTQRFIQQLDEYFDSKHIELETQPDRAWVVLTKEHLSLKQLVESKGKRLVDWGITINRGIVTGLNEAFVIDNNTRSLYVEQDEKSEEIIKHFLRGRDISRYVSGNSNIYMIFTRKGIDIERYPVIEKHLSQFYEDLKPRNNGETKGRKPGPYAWYEIQDNIAYYRDFDKPKLIYPQITKDLTFCYDEEGYYTNDKCFIATGEHLKYLLVWLNSRLFRYCFEEDFPEVEGNARELRKIFMEEVQVIVPSPEEEDRLENLANYLLYLHNEANKPVNPYVENRQVAILFDDIANHLVCELYFADEMREKGVDLASVLKLESLMGINDIAEQGAVINRTYQSIQVMGSPVRDRLKLVIDRLPENVGRILSNSR
ncbi:Eco57I restriction-modification methylase domain-containing protein [Spirosoma radiotolerans]|uniref:Eco57I restriction-modification methylase domain-containing protein n=1 Tax=Spirosoma radiotolerans TaxID=1379870 RepID=UPI0006972B77|nr:Eco57I restriction-modification methylase domain-containing protein [Spirosoma radiotolerans]